MKVTSSEISRSKKKKKLIFISLVLVVAIVGLSWWVVVPHKTPESLSYPLGDKLEYLGKKDYGNSLGFDSFPYSVYYYGTDMSPKEVVQYFAEARLDPSNEHDINSAESNITLSLNAPNTENPIYIDYHSSTDQLKTDGFQTDKRHYITINDEDFDAAKSAID